MKKRKFKNEPTGFCFCGHELAFHYATGCCPTDGYVYERGKLPQLTGQTEYTCSCRMFKDSGTKKEKLNPFAVYPESKKTEPKKEKPAPVKPKETEELDLNDDTDLTLEDA